VGFPVPVVDVRVASPDPATGAGELLIRGPNIVAGYWRKPQQTAETFVDGWLRSGNIGRVDDEGLVYIVDRLKDMINRGGENGHCIEVENALGAHPAVGEVAVPDPMMGEKVGAVVAPQPGHTVKPDELVTFAAGHLAAFKVPQYLVVRPDPLPRNPGGKVLKSLLREQTEWGKPLR
jgi:acyl-CoA synthetase (AMP-forming)/AMP-acid ligase II